MAAPNAEEFEDDLDRVPECDLVTSVLKMYDLHGVDGADPDSNCSVMPGLLFLWQSYTCNQLYKRIDAHAIQACFEEWISACEILEREQMVQPYPMEKQTHECIGYIKQSMRLVQQHLRAKKLQPVAHTMFENLLNAIHEIMKIVTLSTSMARTNATECQAHKYLIKCEVMIKMWKDGLRCLQMQREVHEKFLNATHTENEKLLLEKLGSPSAREAQLAAENARLQAALQAASQAASAREAEQEAAKARLQERVLELEQTQAMYDALTALFDGQKAQKRKHSGGAGEAAEAGEAAAETAAETAAAGFEAGEAAL
jgi:hypothetical protein